MISVDDKIKELKSCVLDKKKEILRLEGLESVYPDLKIHVDRWKKVVYCSASVNSIVTTCETKHNCGCCERSPLEAWFYILTPLGKIYSNPPCIMIGEKEFSGGDIPFPDWEDKLRRENIPENIIEQLKSCFPTDEEID